MEVIDNVVKSLENCDLKSAIKSFVIEQNDEITNGVRAKLDKMPNSKIIEIKEFLNHLLNLCYNGNLFEEKLNDDNNLISKLNEKELFLFKETVIYFLGRLSVDPDIDVIKKAYFNEDNKYCQLNLVFTSLCTFEETIEMDFVQKCMKNSEYDKMLRSWTMAYFKMVENPYAYEDTPSSDWTEARNPRINRLKINDPSNPKVKKAMSFRLLDLLVLYLFIENRNFSCLTSEEKQVVESANIDYEKYSPKKKALMRELKSNILNK